MMGYNTLMFKIIFFLFIISTASFSKEMKQELLYFKVFKNFKSFKEVKIEDGISEFKTNTGLLEAFDKNKKRIGFIREVTTSTGCNDGCLPVIFTLFYNEKGEFLRLLSREGLTKKDHEEFKDIDYIQLESILRKNPPVFKSVIHPTNMVDAITRATLKVYQPHIIARAAYTTLRVNLYNQETLKFLSKNYKFSK
ncbi:MAG: hypothetical protein ACJAT2_000092 [Bacteriovoracaceae bacterium]|jgi:hypothetical protein